MAKSLSQHRFGPQFHNSIIPYPNHLHQQHQTPQRHSTSFPGDSKQGTQQSSPTLRRKPQNLRNSQQIFPLGRRRSRPVDLLPCGCCCLARTRVCCGMREKQPLGERHRGLTGSWPPPRWDTGLPSWPRTPGTELGIGRLR